MLSKEQDARIERLERRIEDQSVQHWIVLAWLILVTVWLFTLTLS